MANILQKTTILVAAALLVFAPHSAQAQPTIDGQTTDGTYIQLGTSPAEPGQGFSGGVVGLNAYAGPDSLYVAVEGQVRNNHGTQNTTTRDIVVFINSKSVNGIDSGTGLPPGDETGSPFAYVDGMQLDMDADFGIRLTGDQENAEAFASIVDYAGYAAGDSTDSGKVKDSFEKTLKSLDGTPETGDATGGTYAYADAADVSSVNGTGFEFSLPHDSLGTSQSDEFQFFVIYTDLQNDPPTVAATLIPDDGETTQYGDSEDWTKVSGTQATGAQVLLVELTSFDAHRDGKKAVLRWRTASETNNAGFVIEHAAGSGDFQRIGWVDGRGTTTEAQSYRFVAEGLSAGHHRFRLKQEDLDGSTSLSKVVEVEVRPEGPIAIQEVAPNPVRETGTLRFTIRESGDVSVALYDVLGREVKTLHRGRVSGGQAQQVPLDASALSSGLYFLRIEGNGFTQTERITVAR